MLTGFLNQRHVFALLACLLCLMQVDPASASPDPRRLRLASTRVVVLDANSGEVLYAKNAESSVPIASITKLMTAMVVLDGELPMDEILTVSNEDIDRLKRTRSRLAVGTRQSRQEMLRLALMSSENRAASALSRHYPGGQSAFVSAMNGKAAGLKMTQTRFADATGLTSLNRSSAADLVVMAQAASQYPLIREFTTTAQRVVSFPKPHHSLAFMNTNRLVRGGIWDIELSKTGFTNEAGHCLVMKTNIADRSLVMVLLNAQGKLSPIGDANRIKRWVETNPAARRVAPIAARARLNEA